MDDPFKERYKLWPSITDRMSFVEIVGPTVDGLAFGPPPEELVGRYLI